MDNNQRIPGPDDLRTGETNIRVLKRFLTEFNKLARWIKSLRDIALNASRHIDPQVIRLTKDLGVPCEFQSSGSSDWHPADGIIQYHDGADFVDTDPIISKNQIASPYGVPHDANDVILASYHSQSGMLVPLGMRTIRHARTAVDADGNYPDSTGTGLHLVYPFKFTDRVFTEDTTTTSATTANKCDSAEPDGFFLNLRCGDWLPIGADVAIYNVTGQWFSFAIQNDCTCSTCRIASDEFKRDNSTDLGADWSEDAGSWEIASQELVATSSSALVSHTTTHVTPYLVNVRIKATSDGDQARVIVGLSGSTYLYAQLTMENGATCGSLELKQSDGTSLLGPVNVPGVVSGEWHTLRVCLTFLDEYGTGILSAVLTTSSGLVRKITADGISGSYDNNKVALGTGTITSSVAFDSFCWQRHKTTVAPDEYTAAEPSCPDCGTTGCQYGEDDFDRADSTDLGCNWNEQSGSWEILTNELKCTAAGTVLSTIPHPDGLATMTVSVRFMLADAGDTCQVLLAAPLGYHVEFEVGATCGVLRLYNTNTSTQLGSDIPIADLVPDEWHTARVCLGPAYYGDASESSVLTAYIEANNGSTSQTIRYYGQLASPAASNIYTGLAANPTSAAYFDDWSVEYTYDPTDRPTCKDCDYGRSCLWAENGTDKACEWSEVSGTWDGVTTSDTNAFFKSNIDSPNHSKKQSLEIAFSADNEAEILGYICYYDSSNYLAAKVTLGATCGTLELIQNGSTLDSINVEPLITNSTHYLCISFDGTYLRADLAPEVGSTSRTTAASTMYRHLRYAVTPHASGYYVGVGTGTNTGDVNFSSVKASQYYDSSLFPDCDTCNTCLLSDVPDTDPADTCEWDTTSGTVAVGTNGLIISTANGYGRYKGNDGSNDAFAYADLKGTVDGQTLRMYINDDGTLSGPWAELEFKNSPATAYLRLSTGETYAANARPNETHSLGMCLSAGRLVANVDYLPGSFILASATGNVTATGKYLACQLRGSAGDAHFSNVLYSRKTLNLKGMLGAEEGTDCVVCSGICQCCLYNIFPEEFLVEISGLYSDPGGGSGCCANFNGAYVVRYAEPDATPLSSYQNCAYRSGQINISPGCKIQVGLTFGEGGTSTPGETCADYSTPGSFNVRVTVAIWNSGASAGWDYIRFSGSLSKPIDCTTIPRTAVPFSAYAGSPPFAYGSYCTLGLSPASAYITAL